MDAPANPDKPTIKKKILVVDDDPDLSSIIQEGLRGQGFDVITAADGYEALKAVKAQRPDLIVADLMMPNLKGWGLAQKLREDPQHKKIPIIHLSGTIREEHKGEELEAGDYYFPKPFDFDKLLAKIKELI